jgi:alpha-beta hydrolase superfamily lysophospholipase
MQDQMADDEAAAGALTVLTLAQADDFDGIRGLFAVELRSMVSADSLRAAWAAEVAELGSVSGVGTPVTEPTGNGITVVKLPITFERGERTIIVAIGVGGKLGGLQIASAAAAAPTAAWEPPPYADPGAFAEFDVMDGHGTLSAPHGAGPWPAVVILAGSGPQDRDGTLGRNKPLKDIAWGLASRGVAVLRFDKATYGSRAEQARHAEFTMIDEYVPDAIAALHLLREAGPSASREEQQPPTVAEEQQPPTVAGERQPATVAGDAEPRFGPVFVLGHSLGGTVAPRVAAADPGVAGLILLAAGAEPLHHAALRQVRYLARQNPAMRAAVEALATQVARVDSADLSPGTPVGELPFGVPAPYWLDLREYDPAALAATLDRPILVLQGGRDYQVTVADDLARWRARIPDATVHVYEADNHAFFPGSGPPTPAEYEPVQHVDAQVVTDIAAWTRETAREP